MFTDIKKQASSFVQEKYKSAKLALTDVSQAELLTEEAINSEPWGPDAKTMTRISEAAYDMDDYWRIVGIIHRRLQWVNYKEWRQSYKALVLLEFLLTHGPEDMFEEFHCDIGVIRELGKMNYLDERGFNWGACMKQKSDRLQNLLTSQTRLTEARSKALKISREIQGFGNLIVSPRSSSSSSSSSPSSSRTSRTSSFGSYGCDSPSWASTHDVTEPSKLEPLQRAKCYSSLARQVSMPSVLGRESEGLHLRVETAVEEKGPLIEPIDEREEDHGSSTMGWSRRFRSRFFGSANEATSTSTEVAPIRSLSDVGKVTKKKIDRQLSLWF